MGQHRRCPSLYLKQESHGTRQNVTYGGLEHVGGRDRLLVLTYINNYITTPCTSKVTSLPDVGGLAVQGRKAGRHNGCILEGSFFPSYGVQGTEKHLPNALPSLSWATGHVTSQAVTVQL